MKKYIYTLLTITTSLFLVFPAKAETYEQVESKYPLVSGYEVSFTFDNNTFYMNASQYPILEQRTQVVKDIALQYAKSIIRDGQSERVAAQNAAIYVTSHFKYDDESADNRTEKLLVEQSAYNLIETKVGVCAGFAKLTKAILESVPFKDGKVNWENGDYHLKVKLASGQLDPTTNHMWANVGFTDGTNGIYDPTTTMYNGKSETQFEEILGIKNVRFIV